MSLHAAALLAHDDGRIDTLRHACDELAASQSRLEYAYGLLDYGAALRRSNRRADARAPTSRRVGDHP